jgi:predicted DNA-binding protein (MmcQ/YjbR family)
MNLAEYNDFCGSLEATSHVVQWGGAHVWKVGGKGLRNRQARRRALAVTFKCSEMATSS